MLCQLTIHLTEATISSSTGRAQSAGNNSAAHLHVYSSNLQWMLPHPLSHDHLQLPLVRDSPYGLGFYRIHTAECPHRNLHLVVVEVVCWVEPLLQLVLMSTIQ